MLETMQGLTPTIIVRFPETIDLTDAAYVYVSFRQGDKLLMKKTDGFTVESHEVDIYLTQEETLMFRSGSATVQVNWTYPSGQRGATRWISIKIDANQLPEVLP